MNLYFLIRFTQKKLRLYIRGDIVLKRSKYSKFKLCGETFNDQWGYTYNDNRIHVKGYVSRHIFQKGD